MPASLFRKSKNEPAIRDVVAHALRSDPAAFVRDTRDTIQSLEPAAATMCVVAMQNLNAILRFFKTIASKHPNKKVPTSLDECLLLLVEDGWPADEIQQRRAHWFFLAMLAKRADAFAETDPRLQDDVVDIWVHLAEGGKYLSALVPQNIIWSEDEKVWFADVKSQRDGAQHVVWLMCPYWAQLHPKISDFADAMGFWPI
jgi:hypothetical protein